jgi:acetyl-CoA carboxylase biotin carboxylase subunit
VSATARCSAATRRSSKKRRPPVSTARLIARVGERCAEACRRINYRGAGTFEFLYENNEFYFIEMNTRIQVEHPVTELITGIDLVQEQIRVAAGEKLRFKQRDIKLTGHALECRINAEDPYKFTPSPARSPATTRRADLACAWIRTSIRATRCRPHYDSMIGKVITYGDSREQAIRRMSIALSEMIVSGIKTNIPLHQELMHDTRFIDGGTSIHYLEQKLADQMAAKVK